MPKDLPADMRIEVVAGKPVELPSGDFVANAEMTRSGTDLHLTTPDGHTVIVEGYFAQQNPPDLVTHDGARLTSTMVDAFVPPEHVGQYAASGQSANDSSPAGRITQEVGDAFIIHADGTKVAATVGSPIYQGDVIETAKTGAVNIQFADNTTFAISENARMSVDQFVYHSADHSGSTFFSMLQGMFVYTSGLIGKTDPGSVSIETPVGSIGIRGTVVAGHILPAGQQSQITIVDGAVTLTNGTGTQDLNTSFATVSVSGYQAQPQSQPMDAHTFNNSYHAISSVASDSLSHFTGMTAPAPTGEHAPAPAGEAAPAGDAAPAGKDAPAHAAAPAGAPAPAAAPEGAPAPTGSAAPAPAPADGSTTQAATTSTAPAAMTTAPTMVTTVTAPPPPSSSGTSSFGSTSSSTFGSTATSTTFSAPATTGSGSSTGTTAVAAPPPPSTTTTATTTTTTTTTTTAGPPPVLFTLHATDTTNGTTVGINVPIVYTVTFTAPVAGTLSPSNFSNHGTANVTVQSVVASTTIPYQYTVTVVPTSLGTLQMGASGITSVGGAQLTNPIQSTTETVTHDMNIQWGAAYLKGTTTTADDGIHSFLQNGSVIGHLASVPGASIGSYMITVASSGQEYNFSGNAQSITSPGSVFTVNTNGDIVVNNYLALSSILNPGGLSISVNAYSGTSGSGNLIDTINGVVLLDSYPTNSASTMQPTIFTGNPTGSTSTSNYMITTNNNAYMTGGSAADILVIAGSGDATVVGGGGADIIIGGAGNDWITVSDSSFLAIDGGGGYNHFQMSGNGTSVDFTALGSMFRNISEIDLGQASIGNNVGVTLNAQNIFDMTNSATGSASANVLNINAIGGSTQDYVDVSSGGFTLTSGIWGISPTLTYTGHAANGSLVTLNITEYQGLDPNVQDSLSGAGAVFVRDSAHLLTPTYETQTTYNADITHKFLVGTASFAQTLTDGNQSGVILIGNSSGQGNQIYVTNSSFSFIDGGAESASNISSYGGNSLLLYAPTSAFTLDFAGITGTPATGTMRNIDKIDLSGYSGNGNSITLNIQDVFNMTNAADNYTLHISNNASNSASLASVTVVTNSSGFHNTIGNTLGDLTGLVAPGTAEYQGTYQGHNVTLVIDNATSLSAPLLSVGSTAIHVATHP